MSLELNSLKSAVTALDARLLLDALESRND